MEQEKEATRKRLHEKTGAPSCSYLQYGIGLFIHRLAETSVDCDEDCQRWYPHLKYDHLEQLDDKGIGVYLVAALYATSVLSCTILRYSVIYYIKHFAILHSTVVCYTALCYRLLSGHEDDVMTTCTTTSWTSQAGDLLVVRPCGIQYFFRFCHEILPHVLYNKATTLFSEEGQLIFLWIWVTEGDFDVNMVYKWTNIGRNIEGCQDIRYSTWGSLFLLVY